MSDVIATRPVLRRRVLGRVAGIAGGYLAFALAMRWSYVHLQGAPSAGSFEGPGLFGLGTMILIAGLWSTWDGWHFAASEAVALWILAGVGWGVLSLCLGATLGDTFGVADFVSGWCIIGLPGSFGAVFGNALRWNR